MIGRLAWVPLIGLAVVLGGSDQAGASFGTTTRVSVDSDGSEGNDVSCCSSMSAAGRFVAFESYASNLVPGDVNGKQDIFIHDRTSGSTSLVAKNSNGGPANGESFRPAFSADGRYVAFDSSAGNLVVGDTNYCFLGAPYSCQDVFVLDRQSGVTTRESVHNDGSQIAQPSYGAAISADGRSIAFISGAITLVPGNTNGFFNIYVRDRQSGVTQLVSADSTGTQFGNGSSHQPAISADGRFVAFWSQASNLVSPDFVPCAGGPGDCLPNAFVRDLLLGETKQLDLGVDGNPANNLANSVAISADGRFVAFGSWATNLLPDGGAGYMPGVFLYDGATGITQGLTAIPGQPNCGGTFPDISSDGRYVSFHGCGPNVVLIHDRSTGITTEVSVSSSGMAANAYSRQPSMSDNGQFVSFHTPASNLVTADGNECEWDGLPGLEPCFDVFVHGLGDVDGDGEWDPFDVTTDSDADHIANPVETICGSNPLLPSSFPERIDGAFASTDDDGDTIVNEALSDGTESYDCDGDGFSGTAEEHVFGSGAGSSVRDQDSCGGNGWPADLDSTGASANRIDLLDVTSFVAAPSKLNTSPGEPGYDVRWDLVAGSASGKQINILDVAALVAWKSPTASPPMLGEARAFGGPACPWAP